MVEKARRGDGAAVAAFVLFLQMKRIMTARRHALHADDALPAVIHQCDRVRFAQKLYRSFVQIDLAVREYRYVRLMPVIARGFASNLSKLYSIVAVLRCMPDSALYHLCNPFNNYFVTGPTKFPTRTTDRSVITRTTENKPGHRAIWDGQAGSSRISIEKPSHWSPKSRVWILIRAS
jgi:hypothetical protein